MHLIAVFEGRPEREVFSLLEREGPAEDVLKTCISRRMIYPLVSLIIFMKLEYLIIISNSYTQNVNTSELKIRTLLQNSKSKVKLLNFTVHKVHRLL